MESNNMFFEPTIFWDWYDFGLILLITNITLNKKLKLASNSFKNKHPNSYYFYTLLGCVIDMIPTLRTLTRKSKLGFGKWKDYTVQELLDLRKPLVLISPYYKLTSINYTEDILDELKITEQYMIEKPSANKEMYYKFLKENGYKLRVRGQGADKLKKFTKPFSKSYLQRMNHGR